MALLEGWYASIARSGEAFRLTPNEWKVLVSVVNSTTVSRVSEQAKLPYSTVIDVMRRLSGNGLGIHFIPYFDLAGLRKVFALIEGAPISGYPLYTTNVYRLIGRGFFTGVLGLVPDYLVNEFFASLPREPVATVVGDEYRHWAPTGRLTRYVAAHGIVVPAYDQLEDVLYASRGPVTRREKKWVDWVDVLIVYFKMKYAFTKLSDVYSLAKSVFGTAPPSRQLMSYHYRTHVSPLWSYNGVSFRIDRHLAPERVYVLRGNASKVAARTLIEAPFFFEALVNEESSVLLAQTPCYMSPLVYRVLAETRVDLPYGELLVAESWSFEWLTSDAVKHYRDHNEWLHPSVSVRMLPPDAK
ncbi:helix-turn-helix domain-containing protein [Thermofilum pendens]|uniref:hypothetical protein n=1 Tax=Thermofilum pendens TaxID=2269 RepID=UPI00069BBD50|nr:hypothetical protein [Thermofilum pendens]